MWVAPESAQHSESGLSESGEKTQPGVRESTSDAMSESLDDMEGVQLVFEAVDWFSLGDIVVERADCVVLLVTLRLLLFLCPQEEDMGDWLDDVVEVSAVVARNPEASAIIGGGVVGGGVSGREEATAVLFVEAGTDGLLLACC